MDTSESQYGGNNYYWDQDGHCFYVDRIKPGVTVVRRVESMDIDNRRIG